MSYTPSFSLTNKSISLIISIGEQLGRLSAYQHTTLSEQQLNASLIPIVQGTLAIEGSKLSESQILDILDGKQVLGLAKEVLEVKNVFRLYKHLDTFQSDDQQSLVLAHKKLMFQLIDEDKQYRWGSMGVIKNNKIIHMAPPVNLVPKLMDDLFIWLKESDAHPLIKSCVMNYELDTIHPFSDGNGRIGRFWQTLILKQYNDVFIYLPLDSVIARKKSRLNAVLAASTKHSNGTPFIEFMLEMINKALQAFEYPNTNKLIKPPQVKPLSKGQGSSQVKKLLNVMRLEQKKSKESAFKREKLQELLGLSDKKSFTKRYLKPALEAGMVEMTIPDKPTSRLQQYQLTRLGIAIK